MKTLIDLFQIVAIVLFTSSVSAQWTQLGNDMDGNYHHGNLGLFCDMNANGDRVAGGAPFAHAGLIQQGEVRVWEFDGTTWNLMGTPVVGQGSLDQAGIPRLDDSGNRLAVAAPKNDFVHHTGGQVRIFQWNGLVYNPIGAPLYGECANDEMGVGMCFNGAGDRIAIGSFLHRNDGCTGTGFHVGQVRVYRWTGSSWVQLGPDVHGQTGVNSLFGHDVAMNKAGDRFVGAAPNGETGGLRTGYVAAYEFNGSSWVQMGNNIFGEGHADAFGRGLAMSNSGDRIVVGAPNNDGNGNDAGHVRAYEWNGTSWNQMGSDIDGDVAGDFFGIAVDLSGDGTRILAGAPLAHGSGNDKGALKVFDWNGTNWVQVNQIVEGENNGDRFGHQCRMSNDGSRVIGGARYNNGGGGNRKGHVRLFQNPPTSGPPAGAIAFDGINDVISVPDHATLDISSNITIEFWMRSAASASAYAGLVHKAHPLNWDGAYGITLQPGTNRIAFFPRGWSSFGTYSSSSIPVGTWTHVAATFDGTDRKVYINGILETTMSAGGAIPTNALNLNIGSTGASQYTFKGELDDVRIWNTARTQTEIAANMSCELTGGEPGLVSYFTLNSPTAFAGLNNWGKTSVPDDAGSNNGTMQNFTMVGTESNWVAQSSSISSCGPFQWVGATSNDWNTASNWSPAGVPSAASDITVDGNVTPQPQISGLVVANVNSITFANNPIVGLNAPATLNIGGNVNGSATVSGTGIVQFDANGSQTINNPLTINGGVVQVGSGSILASNGNLTIENGGSLMHGVGTPNGGGSITGNITYKRTGHTNAQWNHWGSPVAGASVSQLGSFVYEFNETNNAPNFANDWQLASGTMATGVGYTASGAGIQSFTGIPTDGAVNVTITHTTSPTSFEDGWNFLSNPYPSGLEVASFLAANNDFQKAVYLWDDPGGNPANHTHADYAVRNQTGTIAGGAGNVPGTEIGVGQGFMIHRTTAGNGTASFTNGMRKATSSSTDVFLRQGELQRLKLSITTNTNQYNETLIAFHPDATDEADLDWDALKLIGNPNLALYSQIDQRPFAIQALAPVTSSKVIPLTVELKNGSELTFDVVDLENFEATTGLWLEDRETGIWVNLRKDQPYTFWMNEEAAVIRGRFFVHVNVETVDQPQVSTGVVSAKVDLQIFSVKNAVVIRSSESLYGEIQIMNLQGQVVYQETLSGSGTTMELDATSGNYIVRYVGDKITEVAKIHISSK